VRAPLALAFLIAAGCFGDGPVGMFPGRALDAVAAPCPGSGSDNWERFANETESELEVRPARPRSVRTWNLVHDGALYIPADFLTPIKRWPYQVIEDPHVRIRIGGETFACRAVRVEQAALIEAIREHAGRKYAIDPDSRAARVEVWWFRLDPR
jgi:hypothetical protein